MKVLTGIFSLFCFAGLVAGGYFASNSLPNAEVNSADQKSANSEAPQKPDWQPPLEELQKAVSAVGNRLDDQLKKQESERKNVSEKIENDAAKHLAEIESLTKITEQNRRNGRLILNQLDQISERLSELERRDRESLSPESPAETAPLAPPPTKETPESRPTPRMISVQFDIGSLNFTEAANGQIEKAAKKMTDDESLRATVRGNATGFGTGLGKGRAEAVRAKFAEFGVSNDRIKVSDESGTTTDSVSISFRK